MEKFLKDKLLYLIIPPLILFAVIYLLVGQPETSVSPLFQKISEVGAKQNDLQVKRDRLDILRKQKESEKKVTKKESKSGKVIYGVPGEQFSAEASFGIVFENLLANLTNSGIKIRSIQYDYQPENDKILSANLGGYNACEISFVSVGSYAQFQNFFKNIAKEQYLSNIYEVYIQPYDKDKTILITRFKIRLYTRTT